MQGHSGHASEDIIADARNSVPTIPHNSDPLHSERLTVVNRFGQKQLLTGTDHAACGTWDKASSRPAHHIRHDKNIDQASPRSSVGWEDAAMEAAIVSTNWDCMQRTVILRVTLDVGSPCWANIVSHHPGTVRFFEISELLRYHQTRGCELLYGQDS